MSDDLISRKELIENLNKFALEHYSALVNDLIMKEPTAYDVDIVCDAIHEVFKEELDNIFDEHAEVTAVKVNWILKINKKINEIVRNGGKKE